MLWVTRVIAYAIDSFIVGAVGALLSLMAYLPLWVGSVFSGGMDWTGVWRLPFILGAGQVIYFTFMEYMYGASLGKQLLGLRVEASGGGKPSLVASFMRNATKIHAVALFIDVVMGLALTEDPRDKFTDGVSGAYVVRGGAGPLLRGLRLDLPARRPSEGEWAELREWGERDFLEGIGFGVFLLVVATIAFNYPGIHRVLFSWVRGWGMSGLTPVPGELLPPLYWFYTAMGTWSVISCSFSRPCGEDNLHMSIPRFSFDKHESPRDRRSRVHRQPPRGQAHGDGGQGKGDRQPVLGLAQQPRKMDGPSGLRVHGG
jgi:uncharacterized RDD family membrane protein YckC